MGPQMGLVDVFVGKVTATVATFVNVVTGVEVHVHPDVVSAGVHLVTHQTDVAVAGVRQLVDHELFFNLIRCWLPWEIKSWRFSLLSG